MLAVGPSELTKNLLQELAKDVAMRWCMVTDKAQEFLGRSLCWTPQGYTFGVSCDHVDRKVYFMQAWAMEAGQRILKVHGDSQQVADCLTKIMTPHAAYRRALGL